MSISLYDNALIEKIKSWTNKTSIHVYGTDETASVFGILADETNDTPLKLPIITLSHAGSFYDVNVPNKQPLSYDGATLDANYEKSLQLNAIPISIEYQLDVYTRYYKEADEIIRNLIFNIINFPKVTVEIPYNDQKILHDSAISLAETVIDNSDIPLRLIKGQFTRLSLNFSLNDAYIWDVRVRDNYQLLVTTEFE